VALQELARLAQLTRQTFGFYQELTSPVFFALADSVDKVMSLYMPKLEQRRIKIERQFAISGEMVGIKGRDSPGNLESSAQCGRCDAVGRLLDVPDY